MKEHRGIRALSLSPKPPLQETELSFIQSFSKLSFTNNFFNFKYLTFVLAAVTKTVVSSDDILASLWDLHSEALADILDMTIDYDILELPPPIIDEPPQWYVNFINSDREPAGSPLRNTDVPPPGLPALTSPVITLPSS